MITFSDWQSAEPISTDARRAWVAQGNGYQLRVEHHGGHVYTCSIIRPDGNRLDDLADLSTLNETPHGFPKLLAQYAAAAFEWSRDVADLKDGAIERLEQDIAAGQCESTHGLDVPANVMRIRESAYRRGFMQGSSYAARKAAEGFTPRAILAWVAGPVIRWRYRTPRDRRVDHPELSATGAAV